MLRSLGVVGRRGRLGGRFWRLGGSTGVGMERMWGWFVVFEIYPVDEIKSEFASQIISYRKDYLFKQKKNEKYNFSKTQGASNNNCLSQ